MASMNKRALTAYEDTNMYGWAHATNIDVARQAAQEGRDLIIHSRHYDGQRYHYNTYRVSDLREIGGVVIGRIPEYGETWEATAHLCNYALTGRIS